MLVKLSVIGIFRIFLVKLSKYFTIVESSNGRTTDFGSVYSGSNPGSTAASMTRGEILRKAQRGDDQSAGTVDEIG